jgi:amino acid transporter
MSKVAGIFMLLLGAVSVVIGIREIKHLDQLTPYAAWSSVAMGGLMMLAGAAHFRAPHKAFLISIPIVLAFQFHVYCLALFYSVRSVPLLLGKFIAASLLILLLSYMGYRRIQELARAQSN